MILYTGELKDPMKRLLEFVREFGMVAMYKINEHQSMALIYTNNSMAEIGLVSTVRFKIADSNLKNLGLN